MIISASRRTDIPRFHSDWMLNRIREGFVDVRNPMFPSQVSRYSLSPDVVDGIVFWTKDPAPMLPRLGALADYNYYFQFSLTSYGRDVESGLRDKHDLISTFKDLSEALGPERVMWRFDPILLNNKYSPEYQLRAFTTIATELNGFTEKVTISFIDEYNFGGRSIYRSVGTDGVATEQQNFLAERMASIARENGMEIDTCAEAVDLERYGIQHARCVDSRVFERIGGCRLSRLKTRYEELAKDKAQRKECCCIESIDIGWPNTCANGCKYCYATTSPEELARNLAGLCDPASSLLCGHVDPAVDKVKDHRGTGDMRDRSFRFGFGGDQLFQEV
ncbi:MAG: DUF1848 domain-containing protein [Eggerthellaceae bacterium]